MSTTTVLYSSYFWNDSWVQTRPFTLIVVGKKGLRRSLKTTSSLWFGSLLASDNKQLVFRKNLFQCLYTLWGSVHELSCFNKLVPSLQRKPFRHPTSFKRVGQSYLKNLWPSTSQVKKIYIPILLQSPNIEENRHLGKLILDSEKTNSTVGFSRPTKVRKLSFSKRG